MSIQKISAIIVIIVMLSMTVIFLSPKPSTLPLIAIANLGPHASLDATIQGAKKELAKNGFIENKTVRYETVDVGFDASLIHQMITHLKSQHPRVLVVLTTPVAQYAKGVITDIPLIYSVVTDPVAAGLIKQPTQSDRNMTGSSDQQDLNLLLDFAQQILNHPTRIGLLYSTAENNDESLVQMMTQAATAAHMHLLAIPVNQARDVPIAMQRFHHTVDFIYVGASGAIQPTLPVIAAESLRMGIPVINMNDAAVKENKVLASFGVNYEEVGTNTGKLIAGVLHGQSIASLPPVYPSPQNHQRCISRSNASMLGLSLPLNHPNITVVR